MNLVLDASMALSWCITRVNPNEAGLAVEALSETQLHGALVPALWYSEVANTLLVFERAKRLSQQNSDDYLADIGKLAIAQDEVPVSQMQSQVLAVSRLYRLTAYDASYLELALRTASTMATFDRRLAAACREAGVLVFGDPA